MDLALSLSPAQAVLCCLLLNSIKYMYVWMNEWMNESFNVIEPASQNKFFFFIQHKEHTTTGRNLSQKTSEKMQNYEEMVINLNWQVPRTIILACLQNTVVK